MTPRASRPVKPKAALHWVCSLCGPHVSADEDGCCAMCGKDCAARRCRCVELRPAARKRRKA